MGKLLLVRHAQASYGAANYDQLSDHGYAQSTTLGEYLAELDMHFDYIYVGPLKRHWQTYEMVKNAYAQRGKSLPEPQQMIELDEHRWPTILREIAPTLHETIPEIQRWANDNNPDPKIKKRNQLKIFHYCMDLWATGKLTHLQPREYPDWKTFRATVKRALDNIQTQHGAESGVSIAAFTSGGTISAAMGHVLGMTAEDLVSGLNGLVRNTSLTEFLFTDERMTLKSFNSVPHLQQEQITYV